MSAKSSEPACSFCGKHMKHVKKLISSPKENAGHYICNECVAVCVAILNDDVGTELDFEKKSMIPIWIVKTFFQKPKS